VTDTATITTQRDAVITEHIAAECGHDLDRLATFHSAHYHVVPLGIDAVIVEGRITGTQDGESVGVAPTGRSVDVPTCCIYHFDEDRLASEAVYFDHARVLSQLGH
jgi:predicted ester cyclase